MTFIVAFAEPDFALIASDTRSRWRVYDDSIPIADAAVHSFADGRDKIAAAGAGWFTSSPLSAHRELLTARLAGRARAPTLAEMGAAIRAATAELVLDPREQEHFCERQHIVFIGSDDGAVFDFAGRQLDGLKRAWCFCPAELPVAAARALIDAYDRRRREITTFLRGEDRITALVDATTTLFHAVVDHCGPHGAVSDHVTIALLVRDARGVRVPRKLCPAPQQRRARSLVLEDNLYAVQASSSSGDTTTAAVKESGGKAINRLLAKPLAGDPDSLDGTPDGTTYKRILSVASGLVQTASVADLAITKAKTEARSRCRLHHSATQSIANLTDTYLAFDTEDYDSGNLHDTVTNNSRITMPSGGNTGVWLLHAEVGWDANATGYRSVVIQKNRTTIVAIAQLGGVGSNAGTFQACTAVEDAPAVGDYFEVRVTQSSGGNLSVGNPNVSYTFFSATHLW